MGKFIRKYAYCFFMGATFAKFSGYYLNSWQWWFFTVITVILVELRDYDNG